MIKYEIYNIVNPGTEKFGRDAKEKMKKHYFADVANLALRKKPRLWAVQLIVFHSFW